MTQSHKPSQPATSAPISVRNIGQPIRFENFQPIAGFAVESALPGQTVKVCTRLTITSDDQLFHRLAENIAGVITHAARGAGLALRVDNADTLLLVVRANNSAELWLDTAAVSIRCAVKRDMAAGTVLFEDDIADVNGMWFPCVEIGATDRVLCLFRQDWRFALAFDFNPQQNLDTDRLTSDLGTLYRELRYRHLYEAIADQSLFATLVGAGWFPFVEIISREFKTLLQHYEAGFDARLVEDEIVAKFDQGRLERLLQRWTAKPHFSARKTLLETAIGAYVRRDPIAVIKILLTEIEGILNDAYRAAHNGQGAKLKELLNFAVQSAERRAGRPNTLLLPAAFADYLASHTFANFDPVAQTGTAGSRHAVGHGAATPGSYTMVRALQVILTLDQFAFYT